MGVQGKSLGQEDWNREGSSLTIIFSYDFANIMTVGSNVEV